MTFDEFFNYPKLPGIYYFRNTENGKYYIGQAQEIRRRILKHKTNFESGYYPDAHLYRAWKKYGIEVFEVGVLEIVDLPKGEERNKQLDILEKKYIEKFNSYGTGGYNQTRGGDGGIDGYKFTDLQKNRQKINSLITSLDGRYKIYFYDTMRKQYGEALSFQIILDALKKTANRFVEKQICYFGRYILSRSKEKLEKKKEMFFADEYFYSNTDCIDTKTVNLQDKIDKVVEKYRKEIDEFFAKYGTAKYNRKDNKTKKEALRKLQKADLEAGISKKEYMKKYNVKSSTTFYDHVHKLCPDWEMPESELKEINERRIQNNSTRELVPAVYMTDEMREDIINGICCSRFVDKYSVSESSYYRYKHKIEDELGITIISETLVKEMVNEKQEQDILNGITTIDYMKKYGVGESTFYDHRKYVAKKHPEHQFNQNNNRREKVDIELIRKDIENGMSKREFCLKYELSESCYKKYKKIILGDNSVNSNITDEQKEDIQNGMTVKEYREKYNVSKDTFYNHRKQILKPEEITKRHITIADVISEEQKSDLLSGMRYQEYMEKYNCSEDTYYAHRKFVIPDEKERCKSRYDYDKNFKKGLSKEQKEDLLNGMSKKEYMLKYNVSHRTYEKYKQLVTQENDKTEESDEGQLK